MAGDTVSRLDKAYKRVKYPAFVFAGIAYGMSIAIDLTMGLVYALVILLLAIYNYIEWRFGPLAEPPDDAKWRDKNRDIAPYHYLLLAVMVATLAVAALVDLTIQRGADTLNKTITKEFGVTATSNNVSPGTVKINLSGNPFKVSSPDTHGLVGMYETSSSTASLSLFEQFMRPLIHKTLRLVPHFCLLAAILAWLLTGVLLLVDRITLKNA